MDHSEIFRYDRKTQEAFERLTVPFAVYHIIDKRAVPILVSDGFCRLFGFEDRARAYQGMADALHADIHPDDAARVAKAFHRFAEDGGRLDAVYRTRINEGSDYRIIHAYGDRVDEGPDVRLAHVWYSDEGVYMGEGDDQGIELSRSLSAALHDNSIEKSSLYDYLTGLPSMTYFFELAEAGKRSALEKGGRPVMMYMDFSGMKFFNRKHGFSEGDRLLRAFAGILADIFGNEHCCRIGGDHFAVQTEEAGLDEKLKRLFSGARVMNGGMTLPVHVGVYVAQNDSVHTSIACDRAKLACSALSGRYGNAVNYYRRILSEDEEKRRYIVESLDRAIEEKWIRVYLQPIIRTVNGRICDVEALARWIDPEKGMLSPADFIPALEDAGLIYKLDLYMVDQVLETIRMQKAEGFSIVPHSINLSRSDFEEIKRRVDESGVSRDRITIEITESVIGSDFEFMKEQVERFRELGFPVWMDEFGSGYSSLDILQSIKFDLLKFDRSFMQRFDEGENGKVLLTELMKMASSLGVDTVCEGVETEEQVHFLQEIGCSKLQGFYYGRPIPFETILKMREDNTLLKNENPDEASYYESIGRVNLYDLGVIAEDEEDDFSNVYNSLPIAVLEVKDDTAVYIRSNRSYRDFIKRFFDVDILKERLHTDESKLGYGAFFVSAVKQCCNTGNRAFFDEKMPDGSVIHSFVRRVSVNPVKGCTAIAVAVLSVREPDESETYADIARALSADYYNLFIVDLDTEDFIEYSSQVGGEEMSIVRHGKEFFKNAKNDSINRIYGPDREPFLALFTKENVLRDLEKQGVFTTTFRLMFSGNPMYVNMKITRLHGGNRIITGVSNIDSHMKQLEEEKKLRQEKASLGRIAALAPNYLVLYTSDLASGSYTQYNPSSEYAEFGLARQGEDFFMDVKLDSHKAIAPEDFERHLRVVTKENMLREIRENGFFIHHYRMIMGGNTVPVSLRAALVTEKDGEKIILGVTNDELEYKRQLEKAYKKASSTAVTFTHLAHALARGYTDLYYVNIDTDEYIEFHTDDEHGVLNEVRHRMDFFEGCKREVKLFVHQDDQEKFVNAMNRDFLASTLDRQRVFEMTYRRIKDGRTFYVQMKVSRMEDDKRFVVIAVSDIDELVRKRRAEERIQEERVVYARLHALTGNFIVVYVVDPETNHYREFSATSNYTNGFAQAKEGTDFFNTVREVARTFNHRADVDHFLAAFTKENIMAEVRHSGIFTLGYRLIMDGKPLHVQLKAAMVEEKEGPRLIVGINDIDAQVRQEEENGRRLAEAQAKVNLDALTGVKNKHAYLETEARMDRLIAGHRQSPFAIVMLDVNDLKTVNDTLGHQAGDQYLRDACAVICENFKHSPVFRVGGDEFAVISQGKDHDRIEELVEKVNAHNIEAVRTGGIVVACGFAKFENDEFVAQVFERADHRMYENKNALKSAVDRQNN